MAGLCKSLAMDTTNPLPFFIMWHVFLDIAGAWEERPLPVEEAKLAESKLAKPIEDLIEAIVAGASSKEMLNPLNKIISAYLVSFK